MSTTRQTASGGFVEQYREGLFLLGLVLGALVFALGMAFLTLTISMDTTPPAPYFASRTDMIMTAVASIGFIIGGAAIFRLGAKIGGW